MKIIISHCYFEHHGPNMVLVNVQVEVENSTAEDLQVEYQTPDVGKISRRMPETIESLLCDFI